MNTYEGKSSKETHISERVCQWLKAGSYVLCERHSGGALPK